MCPYNLPYCKDSVCKDSVCKESNLFYNSLFLFILYGLPL